MTTETTEFPTISRVFLADNPDQGHLMSCSFCKRTLHEVDQLFLGMRAASCVECMILAHNVIAEDLKEADK